LITLASPDIRTDDIERVIRVLESGALVQGPAVAGFEQALCEFSGVPHCAVVSSGTAALHMALLGLGIGPGDAVLVPAFTFPASANVVEMVGARTVLCDVDPATYVATPRLIDGALDANRDVNFRAIMLVHEFGCPAEVRAIADLAAARGLKLIEDAACALGTLCEGRHPGQVGDLACLSFHPRKAVTTGEGGAVLSRDAEIVADVRRRRNHGMELVRGRTDFVAAGLNYRMTDIQAALGAGQLARFGAELERRRELATQYEESFRETPHVSLPAAMPGHAWQTYMVTVAPCIDRDRLIVGMRARGVQCNLGAQAINCLAYYRERYGLDAADFPTATRLYQSGLAIPMHGRLTRENAAEVVDGLHAELRAQAG
jgi:perosamine synthetase